MTAGHCVLRSYLAAGYWKIKCACGQVFTGPDEYSARAKYVAHKATGQAS